MLPEDALEPHIGKRIDELAHAMKFFLTLQRYKQYLNLPNVSNEK